MTVPVVRECGDPYEAKLDNSLVMTKIKSYLYIGRYRYNDRTIYNIDNQSAMGSDELIFEICIKQNDKCSIFMISTSFDTHKVDYFLDYLKENYPSDFLWLMFHPEILEGKYYEG